MSSIHGTGASKTQKSASGVMMMTTGGMNAGEHTGPGTARNGKLAGTSGTAITKNGTGSPPRITHGGAIEHRQCTGPTVAHVRFV